MGQADLRHAWMHLSELHEELLASDGKPTVVPHEETDLHRVFCDESFCLESGHKPTQPSES